MQFMKILRTWEKFFQIQDKAEKIVTDMKTRIDAVQTAVSEKEPVSVFVYDSGEDAPFTASAGLPTDMIELAGGKNYFRGYGKQLDIRLIWEE